MVKPKASPIAHSNIAATSSMVSPLAQSNITASDDGVCSTATAGNFKGCRNRSSHPLLPRCQLRLELLKQRLFRDLLPKEGKAANANTRSHLAVHSAEVCAAAALTVVGAAALIAASIRSLTLVQTAEALRLRLDEGITKACDAMAHATAIVEPKCVFQPSSLLSCLCIAPGLTRTIRTANKEFSADSNHERVGGEFILRNATAELACAGAQAKRPHTLLVPISMRPNATALVRVPTERGESCTPLSAATA